jgi:TolB-like protein
MKRIALCLSLAALIFVAAPVAADARVAFLSIENEGDPRYDYVAGLISGVLLYDLSRVPGLSLVERSELMAILDEQELGLAMAEASAAKVGKLLSADWLLKGSYVALGDEIAINIKLISVETSRSTAYSERGRSENAVHAIAERIALKLTGEKPALKDDQHERSLLSLRDEKPGSIAVHTAVVSAKIYLDGSFVGYTTGDVKVPFVIDDVDPGPHSLSIRLSGFGEVTMPSVEPKDWERKLDVKAGKRLVVEANLVHLESELYYLSRLKQSYLRLSESASKLTDSGRWELEFVDREGKSRKVTLEASASMEPKAITKVTYSLDGQKRSLELSVEKGAQQKWTDSVGILSIEIDIDARWKGKADFSYTLIRLDIPKK